jgi:molybdopterin-guanine dinucleotide biosynthesis protein A|tara:strand:- start:388 stop:1044 length:657 start_codon:yes stop_codon:yes gene_type:complete
MSDKQGSANETICGVLLAGGLSRRMGGGDKSLQIIDGKPILDRVISRAAPQVDKLVLNVNGDASRFAAYDLPIAPDPIEGFAGPLAGVLAGMNWAADHLPNCQTIVTFATDAPFVPVDLVVCLKAEQEAQCATLACAASNGRNHPVFALWPLALRADLRKALLEEGVRKVDVFTARYSQAVVAWPTLPFDPFFNANRPEDLKQAEQVLRNAPGVTRQG